MSAHIRLAPPVLALSVLTLALTSAVDVARAGVVYDQASSGAACDTSCWTSAYSSGGYQAFDNFTLGAAAAITSVSWSGFYYDYINGANNPAPPATDVWSLNFYADDGGTPGALLKFLNLTAATVGRTYVTTSDFGGYPVNLYQLTVDFPTPFLAEAGVTYWFSPLSAQSDFNPFFSWSPAAVTVDGVTMQKSLPSGSPYAQPGDRAFSLYDDSASGVPEPAAWSLMLIGVAGAGGGLRLGRRAVRSPGRASAMS